MFRIFFIYCQGRFWNLNINVSNISNCISVTWRKTFNRNIETFDEMIIMSCRPWFLWWLFAIEIFSYHSYSALCLINTLSDAFTVTAHCKKYPHRHMWVLADTLLWFQAITIKWYVLSREVANANCIVFGIIWSGIEPGELKMVM